MGYLFYTPEVWYNRYMEAILLTLIGLLVTLSTFYAKDADVLSEKSLRFIKIVIYIVAGGTILLSLIYLATIATGLLL